MLKMFNIWLVHMTKDHFRTMEYLRQGYFITQVSLTSKFHKKWFIDVRHHNLLVQSNILTKKTGCNWIVHRQPIQICWNHPPWVRQILSKSWSLVVKSNAFCTPGNCMEQIWNDMSCLPPIARTWQWKNKTAPRVNQNNKAVHKCLHVNTRCHPVSSVPVLFGYQMTIFCSNKLSLLELGVWPRRTSIFKAWTSRLHVQLPGN